MTERELLDLKDEINDAKNRLAELKGQKSALMKQLKEEWGVTSIEGAEIKFAELKKDISKLEGEIEKGITEIEEKYPM